MLQNNGFGLKSILLIIAIALIIFSKPLIAQDNIINDILLIEKHSPKKATLIILQCPFNILVQSIRKVYSWTPIQLF